MGPSCRVTCNTCSLQEKLRWREGLCLLPRNYVLTGQPFSDFWALKAGFPGLLEKQGMNIYSHI